MYSSKLPYHWIYIMWSDPVLTLMSSPIAKPLPSRICWASEAGRVRLLVGTWMSDHKVHPCASNDRAKANHYPKFISGFTDVHVPFLSIKMEFYASNTPTRANASHHWTDIGVGFGFPVKFAFIYVPNQSYSKSNCTCGSWINGIRIESIELAFRNISGCEMGLSEFSLLVFATFLKFLVSSAVLEAISRLLTMPVEAYCTDSVITVKHYLKTYSTSKRIFWVFNFQQNGRSET